MDKDFHKEFTKCPVCSSEDRFMEQLGYELKDRGIARPEWNMRWDARQGVVADSQKMAALPIGSELPGYVVNTDICMDCGCIYAVDITRLNGKVGLAPQQPSQPNRADRRRIEKLGGNYSNPMLS